MNIELLQKFTDWLQVNGYSKSSISSYVNRIQNLIKIILPEDFTEENLRNYLLDIRTKNTPSTMNGYIKAIKSFLHFLNKDIKLPKYTKTEEKLPKYLTIKDLEDDLIPLIEIIYDDSFKIKTLLYFMFFTGLRRNEITNLKRTDFDLEKRTVKVLMQKVKRERIVPFTKKVSDMLELYFSIEPETKNAFNLSGESIYNIFKKLNPHFKKLNLHPHIMRDSYATHLLLNGIDIRTVSQLLGHKSILTTMKYTGLNIEQIQGLYDKHIK